MSGGLAVQRNTVQRHWLWGPPPLCLWSVAPTHGSLRQPHQCQVQDVLTRDAAFSEPSRSGCQRKRPKEDTACAEWCPPGPRQQPREPSCSQARVPLWCSACLEGRRATTCPLQPDGTTPKQELCRPQLSQSRLGTAESHVAAIRLRLCLQLALWLQGQAPWPCSPPCGAQPGSPAGFSGPSSLGRSCSRVCIWPLGPKSPRPGQVPGN